MADKLDPAMRDQLLKDSNVQEAMKKAVGKMDDPAVQKAIVDAAKNTFTAENAKKVQDNVKEWANDPEVQAKARHYAGMAMVAAGTAGAAFVGVIEQGPAGVQFIAFVVSISSAACSVFKFCTSGINPLLLAFAGYQLVFSLTTVLFEMKPEWVQKVSGLDKYQNKLMDYCKFLSVSGGRGLFYLFQGSIWLMQIKGMADIFCLSGIVVFATGVAQCVVASLLIMMHFGIMPQHLAAKAKAAVDGYKPVPAK